MDEILKKLNYKEGQIIFVQNQPEVFDALLLTLPSEIEIRKVLKPTDPVEFVIVFSTKRAELEELAAYIAPCLRGDAIFWMSYPKGTSKKYKCDFNRDTSWDILKPFNLMPVRQISLDDDWSALRFRKTEYIKSVNKK
jgi:hypothetical protein